MIRVRQTILRAAVLVAVMTMASCAQRAAESDESAVSPNANLGQDLGNAVAHNAAQQILDPVPANVLAGAPDLDGARAAGVYERYRAGRVIAPEALETTNFGTDR